MLQLKRREVSRAAIADKEYAAWNFIPYECHWNDHTIVTKDGHLMQVVKVDGYSFETADDDELDIRKSVRNSLLKSMTQGNFAIWFHTVRSRKNAYPEGKMPAGFAHVVNEMWKAKQQDHVAFRNDLYITIVTKPDTKGFAKVNHWFSKASAKTDRSAADKALKQSYKDLEEAIDRITATLKDYGARRLRVLERTDGIYCEIMEFLGRMVNGGYHQKMRLATHNINRQLPTHRLYFGKNTIEVRGASKTRYAGIVGVKEYCNETAAGMMDSFLKLPFEFIMTQSFAFTNRQTSIERMRRDQNRMINANDPAISQIAEISDALDIAMSGVAGFGTHHLSIMCIEDDIKVLEKSLALANSELINLGMSAARESMNMEPTFWAQLPGNYKYVARKSEISTMNLASLASLHNYPTGNIDGNHWGDAVTVLDTTSETPYFFNFHLRDVGHTTIIGPTGAGKTVLMNFLIAQSLKYNPRMFIFDKDRGADIFVRAIGGEYNIIEMGKTKFNPLHLPDNTENRAFLVEWFKSLLTINDEPLTAQDIEAIKEGIDGTYKLTKADRRLENIAPFFGLEGPGSVASRLAMWHSNGTYAGLFNSHVDTVDFDAGNVFGFEMNEVLTNKDTLGPVLLYLFHKINLSLDGTPTIIVLDEAWALIDNPVFASKIKDWLKTMRKLNAMVIFATQSVEDASKSNINDTLLQQTATQIFLPNMKATPEYRKAFLLSKREFQLIRETDPGSRYFLLKQGNDVVVARLDLGGMEDIIPILSGRAETVRICDEIRAQHGEDPAVWIPIFLKAVENMST